MKQNWELHKLGEVLMIERGLSPKKKKKKITNSQDQIN